MSSPAEPPSDQPSPADGTGDKPRRRGWRPFRLVLAYTRGLIVDQHLRRLTMFYLIIATMIMVFSGALFVFDWREHPRRFVLYWAAVGWLTIAVTLLAVYDLLLLRVQHRIIRRELRKRMLDEERGHQPPDGENVDGQSMYKSREEIERAEAAQLAPYAQRTAASAGRRHLEPPHPYRTAYQRDRARVIHSRAFRRLEYKTQVFLNGTGDHLRTRLTHTIEVASVSRTIARALGLNEDLAEAIALAHDLGHPPFGHPGEDTLDRLMKGHGGFDHNAQSLRIVELIETSYPDFPGLNLSFEVTEGLRKHQRFFDPPARSVAAEAGERFPCPSLEAQIANLADEITYNSHDLDDGLDANLIDSEQLAGLALWQSVREDVRTRYPRLDGRELCASIIRRLIDRQVQDVVDTSAARIAAAGVASADDARRQPQPLIAYSGGLLDATREMRRFLFANVYYHPTVTHAYRRACARLEEVFAAYLQAPARLGQATAERVAADGLHRTVCDYVAGMTDRYLLEEHARLFGEIA